MTILMIGRKELKIEILKLKNTGFWMIQGIILLAEILLLGGYDVLYASRDEQERIERIYEITGMLIPAICSFNVAFLIRQEEQIPNLYYMVAAYVKKSIFLSKLFFAWLIGSCELIFLNIVLIAISNYSMMIMKRVVILLLGSIFLSSFFYIFHLAINIKLGSGISLFLGIFESMQAIIFSNIKLLGIFQYIPFAWLMQWKQVVMETSAIHQIEFLARCMAIVLLLTLLAVKWFESWEGRKNYET